MSLASLICLIAFFYGGGFLRGFETESVLVTTDPLAVLNAVVVSVLAAVLGLRLAASLAWEREHHTMEVLLVGPVPHEAILLSKFCAELLLLLLLVAVYAAYLLVAQPLGAGRGRSRRRRRDRAYAATCIAASCARPSRLGLARSVRGAVVAYLAGLVLLGLFEIVLGMLMARQPQELSLAAAYLRGILSAASTVVDPLSAAARLADLTEGLTGQTPLAASRTLMALGLAFVTLALAAVVSRARGPV